MSLSLKLTARIQISPGRLQRNVFRRHPSSKMSYTPALTKHPPYHPLPLPGRRSNVTCPRLIHTSTASVKIRKSLISALSLDDDRATPAGVHTTPFSIGEHDHRGTTGWGKDRE